MNWEPTDWIRLIALVASFVLFGVGTWMMIAGVSAEGAIDIKSSLISGSLKTGSAGLFIAFLSFVVVIFVVASPRRGHTKTGGVQSNRSRFAKTMPVFWALLSGVAGSAVTAAMVEGPPREGFGLLAGALGFLLLMWVIFMFIFLADE